MKFMTYMKQDIFIPVPKKTKDSGVLQGLHFSLIVNLGQGPIKSYNWYAYNGLLFRNAWNDPVKNV